ncbi:hypothetical protein L218DRAFT_1005973 [Marasmius fiardii PR-910]|nr:hypothetical protein L218DRAFT_1005973 [Marasmius fiardii PR-910]
MRFVSPTVLTLLTYGASIAKGLDVDTQLLTIQRFKFKDETTTGYNEVLNAMKAFHQQYSESLAVSYLGAYNAPRDGGGLSLIATQFFVKNNPDLDVSIPFLEYSFTGTVNTTSALMSNKTGLLGALGQYQSEITIASRSDGVSPELIEEDMEYLAASATNAKGNTGVSWGWSDDLNTIVVINGWQAGFPDFVDQWLESADDETKAADDRWRTSLVNPVLGPRRIVQTTDKA